MEPSNGGILFRSLVLIYSVLMVAGCGGSSSQRLATARVAAPAQLIASVAPTTAVLLAGQSQQFTATATSGSFTLPVWSVNGVVGGSAATGMISGSGMYTAPSADVTSSAASVAAIQITVGDATQNVQATPAQVSLYSTSGMKAGLVTTAPIPVVALYTVSAPQGATAKVDFGTTQSYGLSTSAQAAPAAGGDTTVIVAGMRAASTYHMRATVTLPDGTQMVDSDKTFTTAAIPADELPDIVVTQAAGAAPADGVQLLSMVQDTATPQLTGVATDLQGNVIWYYPLQGQFPFPIKPAGDGHMLVVLYHELREIDLAGNLLYALPLIQVETALEAQGLAIPPPPVSTFDHDVLKLANGHFLLLITFPKTVTDPAVSGNVTGNLIVEWDPKTQKLVWVWNAFDHLDLAHAPFGFPDWTHANALAYSADDGNLLLSMRNQDWIIKINYADGRGDGSVMWRLGPDGDFTLPAGTGPVEWNYGQHYPVFMTPNTTGIFSLMFFNNGTTRYEDDAKNLCGAPATPCYSSVPIFQLDEGTKEAQVLQERVLSPAFSVCCGNVGTLSNGNWEYDLADDVLAPGTSTIREETPPPASEAVWQMQVTGELVYRGIRIPSLYPGVSWSQAAQAAAHVGATSEARHADFGAGKAPNAAQLAGRRAHLEMF